MSILTATSYRKFLSEYLNRQKKDATGLTLSKLAQKAGFSVSALAMIIEGQRDLTVHKLHELAEAMGFSWEETQVFESLVFAEQAKTKREKVFYQKRIEAFKSQNLKKKLRVNDKYLISEWFLPSVLVYLVDTAFNPKTKTLEIDYDFLAKKLGIPQSQLRMVIERILSLGVIDLEQANGAQIVFDKAVAGFSQEIFLEKVIEKTRERVKSDFQNRKSYFETHTLSLCEEQHQEFVQDLKEVMSKHMKEPVEGHKKIYQVLTTSIPVL